MQVRHHLRNFSNINNNGNNNYKKVILYKSLFRTQKCLMSTFLLSYLLPLNMKKQEIMVVKNTYKQLAVR